jgi:hypothetical protein
MGRKSPIVAFVLLLATASFALIQLPPLVEPRWSLEGASAGSLVAFVGGFTYGSV